MGQHAVNKDTDAGLGAGMLLEVTRSESGKALNERFYHQVVSPILREVSPVPWAAGLLGEGSDVLGFDTAMSRDHGWGPGLTLLLPDGATTKALRGMLREVAQRLPVSFEGFPVKDATNDDECETGVSKAEWKALRLEVTTPKGLFTSRIGWFPSAHIEPAQWLTAPEQKLLSLTGGSIYEDRVGLNDLLALIGYFPDDIWLYLLACAWRRIGQEEHLVGRAGFSGDELGAKLIAARLVRDMMRLAFLQERTYAPYAKWFGSAFMNLRSAAQLAPMFGEILDAKDWKVRDAALARAYSLVARKQNQLDVCQHRPEEAGRFYERPFSVIEHSCGFSNVLAKQIRDPAIRALAGCAKQGSVDQLTDSTDVLSYTVTCQKLQTLYRG